MKFYYDKFQFFKHAAMIFMLGLAGGTALATGKYWLFTIALLLGLIFVTTPQKMRERNTWRSLSDSETLFESSAFKSTIFIFLLLAFTYLTLDLIPGNFSAHKDIYNTLVKPGIIFGLSLPFVALIANHHRSIQTFKQITNSQKALTLSEAQNIFSNFIKHKELFTDVFETRAFVNIPFASSEPNILYSAMYSEAPKGILETSDEYNEKIEDIKNYVQQAYREISKIDSDWDLHKEEIGGKLLKIKLMTNSSLKILIMTPNINFELQRECIEFCSNYFKILMALNMCANFGVESKSNEDMNLIIGYMNEIKKMIENI